MWQENLLGETKGKTIIAFPWDKEETACPLRIFFVLPMTPSHTFKQPRG
jgi:hypothetical protein